MNRKVLIRGATGNFGNKIAKLLAKSNAEIILAGRRENILISLKNEILNTYPSASINIAYFDIYDGAKKNLKLLICSNYPYKLAYLA